MKLLLYTGGRSLVEKSGIGRAIAHQEQAFAAGGLDYTENAKDAYTEIHLNTVFPDSLWMARKARKQGKRVIYHGHSTREDFCNSFVGSNLLAPLFGKWLRLCYNSADQVVTPTPYAARLLGTYGLKSSVEVIPNGVNVYKSSSLEQFRTMMARMLQKEAPDLTEAGFRTAAGRDIHVIGQCYRQLAACL